MTMTSYKDLLDEEMAEMRWDLNSLKPSSDHDTIMPKQVIVTAPIKVDSQYPPTQQQVGRIDLIPHTSGTGNYKWIIDQNCQLIYVPSSTD